MAYTNLGQQLKSNLTSFLPTQQTQRPATDFSSLMATAQQQNAARQKAQQTQFTDQAKQAATAGLGAVMPFQARNQYETQRVANQQQQAQGWLSNVNEQQQVARNQYETQRVAAQNKALADQQALQQKVITDTPSIFQQWFPGAGLTYNKDAAKLTTLPNFTPLTGAQLGQNPSVYGTLSNAPYAMFEDIFQGPTLDAMGQAQMTVPFALLDFVKDPAEKDALFKELNQYAGGLGQYTTAGKTAYDQFFTDANNKLRTGLTTGLSSMQSQYEAAVNAAKSPATTYGSTLDKAYQDYAARLADLDAQLAPYVYNGHLAAGSPKLNQLNAERTALVNWGKTSLLPQQEKLNAANAAWVDQFKALEPKYQASRSGLLDQYAGLYNKYNQGDTNFQQGALAAAYKAMEAARPQDQNLGSILSKYISGDELARYIKSKPTGDYSEGMLTYTGNNNVKYVLADGTVSYTEPRRSGHGMFGGGAPAYTVVAMTPQEVAAQQGQQAALAAADKAKWADASQDTVRFGKYTPMEIMFWRPPEGYVITPAMRAEAEQLLKTPEGMAAARSKADSIAWEEAWEAEQDAELARQRASGSTADWGGGGW